jgi:hypothetical protein
LAGSAVAAGSLEAGQKIEPVKMCKARKPIAIATNSAYSLNRTIEILRSERRSLSVIVNSFQYGIAGLVLSRAVNQVLISSKNTLRLQTP